MKGSGKDNKRAAADLARRGKPPKRDRCVADESTSQKDALGRQETRLYDTDQHNCSRSFATLAAETEPKSL